jgi:hypothetical protein
LIHTFTYSSIVRQDAEKVRLHYQKVEVEAEAKAEMRNVRFSLDLDLDLSQSPWPTVRILEPVPVTFTVGH